MLQHLSGLPCACRISAEGPGPARQGCAEKHVLLSRDSGDRVTSLKVDEEEEAAPARVGASLGQPSGVRHSAPAREPQRTGADETCLRVCMMKSSWLTTSLPSSRCPHPFCPSSLPSTFLHGSFPNFPKARPQILALSGAERGRAGPLPLLRASGATCLFSQAADPPPAWTARSEVLGGLIQNIQR